MEFFKQKLFLRMTESYKNPKLCKMVNFGLADTLKTEKNSADFTTEMHRQTFQIFSPKMANYFYVYNDNDDI